MLDFSSYLNLPLIWGGIIAVGIFLYVLLDGADLGIGILFPFAPTQECRDRMMNSIAPFWDGNETWLVLGGGGLLAAFPLAYSILMPAFYLPILLMLLGLILRGVAFEFRFKAQGAEQKIWDYTFHFGSLAASFFQGTMLGTFVQGIPVVNNAFAGTGLDWVSPFALVTGLGVTFGYGLLGATWVIMKTEGHTQEWSRKCALYLSFYIILFMIVVCLWTPFLHSQIFDRWFSSSTGLYLMPIPLLTFISAFSLFQSLIRNKLGDI